MALWKRGSRPITSSNSSSSVAQNPSSVATPLAWLGLLAGIGAGIALGNPAVGLLAGLAVRLILDVNPVADSGKIASYSLQSAIILLGLTLTLGQLVSVSAQYGWLVAGYVLGTFALGVLLWRLFAVEKQQATLLTAGTGICGGTAIATLAPIIKAQPQQLAVASALVFLLNVVAVFTFPAIGKWLELSQQTFGAWVALAVHDTSSVVATAAAYGEEAVAVATTVKLGRTLWLIPVAFIAGVLFKQEGSSVKLPVFVLLFVAAAVVGSFVPFTADMLAGIKFASKILLVVALTLIGLEINRAVLRQISLRVLAFGVGLWLIVAPLALLLVQSMG